MKRTSVLISALLILTALFSGCSKDSPVPEISAGTDFSVGALKWGVTLDDAGRLLRKDAAETAGADGSGAVIKLENVLFCGESAAIEYIFMDCGGGEFLNGANILLSPEYDRAALIQKLDEVWGERIEYYPGAEGGKLDSSFPAPEEKWYWRSDAFTDEYKWKAAVTAKFENPDSETPALVIDATGLNLAAGNITSLPYSKDSAADVTRKISAYARYFSGASAWAVAKKDDRIEVTVYTKNTEAAAKKLLSVYGFADIILAEQPLAPSALEFGADKAVSIHAGTAYTDGLELKTDIQMKSLEPSRVLHVGDFRVEAEINGEWYKIPNAFESSRFALDQWLTDSDFTIKLSAYQYDFPPGHYRYCQEIDGMWYAAGFDVK